MEPLFAAGTALVISLAIIPIMISLAPRLRLLDKPNERKVHVQPIPRVGGWGIAVGALAATLIWIPMTTISSGFVAGGLVLLIAGAIDDMFDLPGKHKLVLQLLAILPALTYSGLVVTTIPFVSDIHPPYAVALALTAIGLVTCINATNTSDGLDGLAAGATFLSLFGMLSLAFAASDTPILVMAAAALGGLIGFLRYNTYPAVIFMGDLGSQFLGFSVGFLVLALLHTAPGIVSPWSLLLLLGLPSLDLVVVAMRRLLSGKSLFIADQNHIHHRFLDLGYSHNQSVTAFYTIQSSFVLFGVALGRSSSWIILLVYVLHFVAIYGLLRLAEKRVFAGQERVVTTNTAWNYDSTTSQALLRIPRLALEWLLPLMLLVAALTATNITPDFGILGATLLILMLARLFYTKLQTTQATRIPVFLIATAVLMVYTSNRPFESGIWLLVEFATIGVSAAMVFIAIRFSPKRRKEEFRTTATDYLLFLFAILAVIALRATPSSFNPYFLVYLPAILYSCELLIVERRQRTSWLPPAGMAASAILAVRGLYFGV